MRPMRTLLTVVGLSVVPFVSCYYPGQEWNGQRQILGVDEDPLVEGNLFHRSSVFPGETFQEETDKEVETLQATWQIPPRMAGYTTRAGSGKASKKSWAWRDPCDIKPGKGTKAPSSRSTKSPSSRSTKAPSSKSPKSKGYTYECDEGETPPADGGEVPPVDGGGVPPVDGGEVPPVDGGEAPGTAVPNPSPAPGGTVDWEWPEGEGGTDIDVSDPGAESEKCAATRDQVMPALTGTTESEFTATVGISYVKGVPYIRDGILLLFQDIQNILALWVVGCEELARSLATTLVSEQSSRRRLEDAPTATIEYVETTFSFPASDPCPTRGEQCSDTVLGSFVIQHMGVSDAVMEGRIIEAFQVFQDLIPTLSADQILMTGDVTVQKEDEDDVSRAEGDELVADDPVNVATVIGATAGGLAFVLLIVLLVRRKTAEEEVSHLKMDEDGEDTFIREFETASNPSAGEGYETRNVHVVGETDSIFSGWTGYTPHIKTDDEMDAHERDVHKCSSATCEVCEAKRQQGIQFIPTSSPTIQHIPSDASREYVSEDTVEL